MKSGMLKGALILEFTVQEENRLRDMIRRSVIDRMPTTDNLQFARELLTELGEYK
jgi:hypothetical protein